MKEYTSKMQCFIPVEVREAIDTLQQEMRLKGISRRESSISGIFIALVKDGIKLYEQPSANLVAPNHTFGPKTINIPIPRELRIKITQISAGEEVPNRKMVNNLAWWGIASFTQYVHGLPYPIAPVEKIGRPRKQKEAV